jgi:ACS family tartrate transporter-like MFS transporter
MPVASTDTHAARPEATRGAFLKAAWRIVPFVTFGYLLNYMDRNNVGFAALTMNRETGLTATQFGFGAGILFLGYSTCEIPSNIALYHFGARRWLARIMITWGIVSAATAFVAGPRSWYVLRLLLGIAEAGYFPGVTYYLATWFPAEYRARMLAWFLIAVPASTVVGGPVSGLLLQMNGVAGMSGWQWLFFVEGLPVVLLGLAALWLLPDRPEDATFLTAEERLLVRAALDREPREREKRHLAAALKDPRVLLLAASITLALIGTTSARAILWTIPTRFLTGLAAAGGLAFINSVATIGGFVGPYAMGWLRDATGSFSAGLIAMAGLLMVSTLMSWSLKFVVTQE